MIAVAVIIRHLRGLRFAVVHVDSPLLRPHELVDGVPIVRRRAEYVLCFAKLILTFVPCTRLQLFRHRFAPADVSEKKRELVVPSLPAPFAFSQLLFALQPASRWMGRNCSVQ